LETRQASALTIGGNRPNANYFLVDGVTNTDPTFNTQNISLSPDAVQEFQVQTGKLHGGYGGRAVGRSISSRIPDRAFCAERSTIFCATALWTRGRS